MPRGGSSEAVGKCRGRSIVYYVDNTGVFNERMELRFDPQGELTILAGTLSHGQGHETSYAQMVADWLGVPEDKIHLAQADTDEVAIGRGTYASRSMMIGGSALRAAADEVIDLSTLALGTAVRMFPPAWSIRQADEHTETVTRLRGRGGHARCARAWLALQHR